jgi:outer membrane protein assembly factor BamB
LERGPAYGDNPQSTIRNPQSSDWPTYRHDAARSGSTNAAVPADLKQAWQAKLGGHLTQPVIAEERLFVASTDVHTVHALDARDAKPLWSYTAGARVDSPPTVHRGLAIFGSADGRVYCLRAADGALAWRLDAAPRERRVMAFGQLESPWPVHGSVLVHEGKCWFAAGRSSYLDGGIHLYALDPATGQVADRQVIYSPDPKTGKMSPVTSGHAMAGLLNDIPATDGANVFIRQMKVSSSDGRGGPHLYTTGGFLDPSWFNRTFWKFGRAQTSGLMVLGKDAVYGVEVYASRSRETVFKPGSNPYRLRCFSLKPVPPGEGGKGAKAKRRRRLAGPKPVWEQRVGIRITAMVRAGDTIFVAGSPDVVDPEDPHGAWEGRKGGVLAAFSAAEGEKLAEHKLPSPPVWDGMAAVPGRLYVALTSGDIVCFRRSQP